MLAYLGIAGSLRPGKQYHARSLSWVRASGQGGFHYRVAWTPLAKCRPRAFHWCYMSFIYIVLSWFIIQKKSEPYQNIPQIVASGLCRNLLRKPGLVSTTPIPRPSMLQAWATKNHAFATAGNPWNPVLLRTRLRPGRLRMTGQS